MPVKSFKPFTPTRRFQTYLTRDDITKETPEKGADEREKADRRPRCARADFVALPRRRPQEVVPRDRFQA